MQIESSAFQFNESIPVDYTCEGTNISPPLRFSKIPETSRSLVLIMDDPDAPQGTFDHWIVWGIPPTLTELSEGAPEFGRLAPKPVFGVNHYGKNFYKGPCPPPGKPHRYFFKLFALDSALSLPEGSSKKEVESAMEGHILAQAELIGIYRRG